MRNHNLKSTTRHTLTRPMLWGYQDALLKRWRPDYETMPEQKQAQYEVGRLIAAGMGDKAPFLRRCTPDQAWAMAYRSAGGMYAMPVPRDRMPEQTDLICRARFDRRGFPLPVPTVAVR